MALVAYIVAAVLLGVGAEGGTFITDNPTGWGFFFVAVGLALASLGYGSFTMPRRGP